MKTKITLLMLFVTMAISAQVEPFFGFSIDPKMAIEGPYKGKTNDIGTTFNGEFKVGVEFDNLRYTMMVEIHPAINYTKWTWIALDYKITDFPIKRFGTYVGLESSVIYRTNSNPDPTDGNNYKRHQSTRAFNPGVNLEFQYRVYKTFYLSSGINVFGAEEALTRYDKYIRWDWMIGGYIKF
jgi:hypothetical protein